MIYPYRCPEHGPFEVEKSMMDSDRPEPCPVCGLLQEEQDITVVARIRDAIGDIVATVEVRWRVGPIPRKEARP